MTPQEKAKELVEKMYLVHSNFASEITMYFAKQCALIAIDEILNISYFIHEPTEDDELYKNYWQQVKQEIEKL
jgi:hypothetical protein